MLRRQILSFAALAAPAAFLAACTASTTGTVTTVTINVAQVDAWAHAFENAANLILSLPGMNAALGGAAPLISIAMAAVATDVAAFDKSTAGSAKFTFDRATPPTMLTSILADGRTILTAAQSALGASAKTGPVATYIAALATIVSLFEATAGIPMAGALVAGKPMSEGDALAALHVHP